jgi:hypothetical protein
LRQADPPSKESYKNVDSQISEVKSLNRNSPWVAYLEFDDDDDNDDDDRVWGCELDSSDSG